MSRYFYGHAVRDSSLDSVAEEVDGLHSGQWKAASVDFRAICIRTEGREPPSNSEVATREQFIAILEEPYWRFNFVGYFDPQLGLQLDLTGSRSGTVTPDESIRPPQGRSSLPIDAIVGLRELVGLTAATDSLTQRMRGILRRNKDYKDQHPNTPLRQLALYLLYDFDSTAGIDPPTHAYAEALARAIGMRVKVLPGPIEFRPEFVPTVPTANAAKKIVRRGRIRGEWGGGTADVTSLHDLDLDMKEFDP